MQVLLLEGISSTPSSSRKMERKWLGGDWLGWARAKLFGVLGYVVLPITLSSLLGIVS
jgi:hypothetical protein